MDADAPTAMMLLLSVIPNQSRLVLYRPKGELLNMDDVPITRLIAPRGVYRFKDRLSCCSKPGRRYCNGPRFAPTLGHYR